MPVSLQMYVLSLRATRRNLPCLQTSEQGGQKPNERAPRTAAARFPGDHIGLF